MQAVDPVVARHLQRQSSLEQQRDGDLTYESDWVRTALKSEWFQINLVQCSEVDDGIVAPSVELLFVGDKV